jgi:hypothetical protein
VELCCPSCVQGGFEEVHFFDAKGRELCGDPETWRATAT